MRLIITILLTMLTLQAWGTPNFSDTSQVMKRYDYDSGLSQVSVTALAQDQFGYIWIGTQAGLNRFDGHEFKQFVSKQQNKNSLAGGFITSLCHESNKLWIGTSTGLSVYHTDLGIFQTFLASEYEAIASDRVAHIDCKTNKVIVSTEIGFPYVLDVKTLQPEALPFEKLQVKNVVRKESQYFYLTDDSLSFFDSVSNKHEIILEGNFRRFEISASRIYLFNQHSTLIVLDTNSKKVVWQKEFDPDEGAVLNDLTVSADQITLATENGVYLLNLSGKVIRHWKKTEQYQQGLQDNNILSVMRDSDDDLWIGTETRGLQFLSKLSDSFGHVGEFNYNENPIGSPDVRGFALDGDGTLWIATSDGPKIFDGFGFIKPAQIYPQMATLENVFITKLFIHGHHLWITTRGAGIYRLDLNSSELSNWRPEIESATELNFNDVNVYDGAIVTSSRGSGLLLFDERTQRFEPFFKNLSIKAPNHVTSIMVQGRTLWFGSVGDGLYRFQDGRIEHLTTEHGLASDIVFMIVADDKGKIWVASEAGLSIVSNSFSVERTLRQTDGLANDAIWSVIFDGKSHVWVGTSGGLSQIDVNDYTIYNFLPVDGVQDYEFNYNAAWLSPDGRVFMGGSKGFNQFYPEKINIKEYQNPLIISEIAVLGEQLQPSEAGLINRAPELTSNIELQYDQDIISLQFSSLEFTSDRQLKYFYRVIGLSDTWLRLANGTRQVNLLKLSAGDYQVEVYTVNRFNQHSPTKRFAIKVYAPIWWNFWSKSLYSIVLLGLIAIFLRMRQKRFKQVVDDNKKMTELQERLELSLWASGDELWDWHLKTKQIFRHRVTPRIEYGDSFERLEVEDMSRYVHPKDCILLEDKLESCIKGIVDSYEVPLRVKDIAGNWVWVLDRGKVVTRDSNGIAIRIAGALKDITELKSHQDALQKLNEQLEIKVAMRTDELYKKNQKLEQAMMELKRTQQDLIESERMASLGNLVAGVAHEINTPLGVAITALTYNMECLSQIEKKLESKTLKQSDLEKSIVEQNSGYGLVMRNLDRAQTLITNFKQVAVDQSSETERVVNIKKYIMDVFDSLSPMIKGKGIEVEVTGEDGQDLLTYPGAIYQILTNLLNNSVIHGFEKQDNGKVTTEINLNNKCVEIIYRDNGVGVKPEIIANIFDPFVTSKRNQGGCGLGMHIVYNLVTQLLKGDIKCHSKQGQGVEFVIKLPIQKVEGEEVA